MPRTQAFQRAPGLLRGLVGRLGEVMPAALGTDPKAVPAVEISKPRLTRRVPGPRPLR